MSDESQVLTRQMDQNDAQTVVLQHMLSVYPAPFTRGELVHELAELPDSILEPEAVKTAVIDLALAEQIHVSGRYLWPTRAVVLKYG